jgi:hypothetical protein
VFYEATPAEEMALLPVADFHESEQSRPLHLPSRLTRKRPRDFSAIDRDRDIPCAQDRTVLLRALFSTVIADRSHHWERVSNADVSQFWFGTQAQYSTRIGEYDRDCSPTKRSQPLISITRRTASERSATGSTKMHLTALGVAATD